MVTNVLLIQLFNKEVSKADYLNYFILSQCSYKLPQWRAVINKG